jgi:transcriptional regulator with XRE-family HTH domain
MTAFSIGGMTKFRDRVADSATVRVESHNRKEDATLAGRIKLAMAAKGMRTPTELAARMKIHRQTAHKWINGASDKLTPEMLFNLSDALGVNARWLAMGPPNSPIKPTSPDPDTQELIQIRDALQQAKSGAADKWIRDGRELLSLVGQKTTASPFSKVK